MYIVKHAQRLFSGRAQGRQEGKVQAPNHRVPPMADVACVPSALEQGEPRTAWTGLEAITPVHQAYPRLVRRQSEKRDAASVAN